MEKDLTDLPKYLSFSPTDDDLVHDKSNFYKLQKRQARPILSVNHLVDFLLEYDNSLVEKAIHRYREVIEGNTYNGVIYYDAMEMEEAIRTNQR